MSDFVRPVHSRLRTEDRSWNLPLLAYGLLAVLASAALTACGGGTEQANQPAAIEQPATSASKPGAGILGSNDLSKPTASATIPVAESPPLQIVPPVLDFGFIPPNTAVEGAVKLVNRGNESLTILAAEPSCKCTTLEDIGGSIIPPGGSIELKARLDESPNISTQTSSIKILVDGYPVVKTLDIKAQVSLPIRPSPNLINAVRGQNRQGRIVIESLDGQPFSICSFHGMEPQYLGFDPVNDAPRAKYVLTYDLDRFSEPYPRYLIVETDRPDVPVVDVYLRHESTLPQLNRSMMISGGFRFPLGRMTPGQPVELEVPFKSMTGSLSTAFSGLPGVEVSLMGTRTQETDDGIITYALLRVTPSEDFRGVLFAPVEILGSTGASAVIKVFGVVVPEGEACSGVTVASTP